MNKNPNKYLERRGENWYYFRRAPSRIAHLLSTQRIRKTLNTKNIDEARLRRDVLNKDLEEQWGRLAFYGKKSIRTRSGEDNYQLARARCELHWHCPTIGFEGSFLPYPIGTFFSYSPLREAVSQR